MHQCILAKCFQASAETQSIDCPILAHIYMQVTTSHSSSDGLLRDMCDGSYFREHPLFQAHPDALQLQLFYDDVEVVNPLGTKTKKHKLCKCNIATQQTLIHKHACIRIYTLRSNSQPLTYFKTGQSVLKPVNLTKHLLTNVPYIYILYIYIYIYIYI